MISVETATRFVGRWVVDADTAMTTTPGAYFDLAFSGQEVFPVHRKRIPIVLPAHRFLTCIQIIF